MTTTTATIKREFDDYDLVGSCGLTKEFTLTISESEDAVINKMKQLLFRMAESNSASATFLLDMSCLRSCGFDDWKKPVKILLPALKRFGTDEQVNKTLEEFAIDNSVQFTNFESFNFGRIGGIYFKPSDWWCTKHLMTQT